MEPIEHILGICGEPHFNLYTLLLIFILSFILYKKYNINKKAK